MRIFAVRIPSIFPEVRVQAVLGRFTQIKSGTTCFLGRTIGSPGDAMVGGCRDERRAWDHAPGARQAYVGGADLSRQHDAVRASSRWVPPKNRSPSESSGQRGATARTGSAPPHPVVRAD